MHRRDKALWLALPMSERRALRSFLRALQARYGPFDQLAWRWAILTTETWWTTLQASEAAVAESVKRRSGKGRRPTAQAVDRRLKRQGLGVGSLDAMLRRLEELARPTKRATRPEDIVRELRARGGERP